MTTLYVSHPAALDHAVPEGHPERPDRIRAIERVLENERYSGLVRTMAPQAEASAATLAHPAAYVEAIVEAAPKDGMIAIDSDTLMSPGSLEATLRAVGGGMLRGRCGDGGRMQQRLRRHAPAGPPCRARPGDGLLPVQPRRHRRAPRAGRRAPPASRIVDWDVHHGNGTQDIFWDDGDVMYCLDPPDAPVSRHRRGLGAGREEHHRQRPAAAGRRRRGLPRGVRGRHPRPRRCLRAGRDHPLRGVRRTPPRPLANLRLTEADFGWATRRLMEVADRHAGGRLVSMLEGGYSLDGLGRSVGAHVDALMGR